MAERAPPHNREVGHAKAGSFSCNRRASYQRWLGTEPDEIAVAAEVLRRFAPEHPCLLELEVRLCRARQIKAMLAEILHPERMEENDEEWRRL